MRRLLATLAIYTIGIAACDHRATEPDPCAGVAQEGEFEIAILSTAGTSATGDTIFVGDTIALIAYVSEVLSVSPGLGGIGLCEVEYGPPIAAAIEWSSSNALVATVSATGVVAGRERGNAVISARVPALGLAASREIAVWVRGAGSP
jgi:hypothetical protein